MDVEEINIGRCCMPRASVCMISSGDLNQKGDNLTRVIQGLSASNPRRL
jgi:hypothetical protein